MCQENDNEQNPIIQKILDILYATEVSKTTLMPVIWYQVQQWCAVFEFQQGSWSGQPDLKWWYYDVFVFIPY